jgi:hypothetical protein
MIRPSPYYILKNHNMSKSTDQTVLCERGELKHGEDANEDYDDKEDYEYKDSKLDTTANTLTELPKLSNLERFYCLNAINHQLTKLSDLSQAPEISYLNIFNNQLTELGDLYTPHGSYRIGCQHYGGNTHVKGG